MSLSVDLPKECGVLNRRAEKMEDGTILVTSSYILTDPDCPFIIPAWNPDRLKIQKVIKQDVFSVEQFVELWGGKALPPGGLQ